eukprot:TRINITY_DN8794_c0_g1_i1.p1 TRINITY_DN8794_c0_g1~~TRINITY_DN8794_c0_g1_i1.p1  ORF type:complete len:224 (-),score=55.64 TRINITY_DN8794_c0_g1_i1:415-1086(-)
MRKKVKAFKSKLRFALPSADSPTSSTPNSPYASSSTSPYTATSAPLLSSHKYSSYPSPAPICASSPQFLLPRSLPTLPFPQVINGSEILLQACRDGNYADLVGLFAAQPPSPALPLSKLESIEEETERSALLIALVNRHWNCALFSHTKRSKSKRQGLTRQHSTSLRVLYSINYLFSFILCSSTIFSIFVFTSSFSFFCRNKQWCKSPSWLFESRGKSTRTWS